MRHVVVITRLAFEDVSDGTFGATASTQVVGPFRTLERAEKRAQVIRREALTWEDPEGVTGHHNNLFVTVGPLLSGHVSAATAITGVYE